MLNKTNDTCKKCLNCPELICSRGFDSIATPTNDRIGETVTPFTQIASIDIGTNYHCNPKVLLDISTFINSTLVRNETLINGRGDIQISFRVLKYNDGTFSTVSPNYIYSKTLSSFNNESSATVRSSNSFEFQFCDHNDYECCECITYFVEYSATLSATRTGVGGDVLISLSTSIANITLSALLFDSD